MSLDLEELVDLAYEEGKTPPKEVIRGKAIPIFMKNIGYNERLEDVVLPVNIFDIYVDNLEEDQKYSPQELENLMFLRKLLEHYMEYLYNSGHYDR
jgi:hypothetical protein